MSRSSRSDRRRSGTALICLILAGCSGGSPNHLGNPLLLPLSGVAAAAENAVYDARRREVSAYLAAHQAALQRNPDDAGLWAVANIPPDRQNKVAAELAALGPGPDWVAQATIIVMVHRYADPARIRGICVRGKSR